MPFFAAGLALSAGSVRPAEPAGWSGFDVDLDDVESLDEVAEVVRDAAADSGVDDEVVVLLLEEPDEWFAVLRLDDDEDALVYVSQCQNALRHAIGEVLLPTLARPLGTEDDLEVPGVIAPGLDDDPDDVPDEVDLDLGADANDGEAAREAGGADGTARRGPFGDPSLLADLGVPPAQLQSWSDRSPGEAVALIAEGLGCADALESVR